MRVRARFTKTGKVRFISHRDVARIWERALRRTELPVAYSAGFSPRPKLHFGLALSVGHESCAEYLDIDVADELSDADVSGLPARLSGALPTGMVCTAAAVVAAEDKMSLQEAVSSCTWRLELAGGDRAGASAAVEALLAAETVVIDRERKGKTYVDDIRPYVRHLELDAGDGGAAGIEDGAVVLLADIGTQPRALRPAELVAALGAGWTERRVRRLAQWIDHDGERREPLRAADGLAGWERTTACAT